MSTWPPPVRPPVVAAPTPVPTPSADLARTEPAQQPSPRISQIPYLPGLDGLRALAVIAVMVYHADHRWLPGGFLGVEVFFVISGYLITLLLIGEHERHGRVSLRAFWKRRFRRLIPAVVVMLALLAVYMAVWMRKAQWQVRGDFVAGLGYISNWYQVWVGQGYAAGEAFAPLRHLWSLAVEEQFYLVWPLIMVLILRRGRRHLPRIGIVLLIVSGLIAIATAIIFRGGDIAPVCSVESMHGYVKVFGRCINVNETLYLSTISRAGGLMLGAGMAMLWRPMAIMRGPLRNRRGRLDLVGVIGVVGLAALCWWLTLVGPGRDLGIRYDSKLFRGGLILTGFATLLVIAAVTHQRSRLSKVLGWTPIRWVGTRSYGLYLYHWPIFQIVRKQAAIPLKPLTFLLCLVATAAITELSYRVVEMPIRMGRLGEWLRGERRPRTPRARRQRRRLAVLAAVAAATVSFATVSIGLADQQCVTRQECDNEAAAQAMKDAPKTPLTLPPSPSTTVPTSSTSSTSLEVPPDSTAPAGLDPAATPPVDPAATAPPPTEPVETAPPVTDAIVVPSGVPVLAIGESVMLGALPQMQAGGITVDAQVSRQGLTTAELLESVASFGGIPPIVVIQTGTNGSVSNATFARIMAQLPPDKVALVVFLTVKAPKGWIAENNAKIRALPTKYPNVRVVDWEAAAAQIAGELSASDGGVHLGTVHAKQFYANLIFDGIGRPDLKR